MFFRVLLVVFSLFRPGVARAPSLFNKYKVYIESLETLIVTPINEIKITISKPGLININLKLVMVA